MIEIHKLVRSKRKTLALIVEEDGTLTVRAPLRMKEADIWRFIEAKSEWIKRKQTGVKREAELLHQYEEGETFLYLGKAVPLRIVPTEDSRRGNRKPALVMDGFFKLTKSAQPQAESLFEDWYKKQARAVLTKRVEFFAHEHGFKVKKLRVSSARMRWGSCSTKGTLSFTWRLVMAPLEVIDYVVVHELCHLKELNHSKAFWSQVEAILPDYKRRRAWLKKNGNPLRLSVLHESQKNSRK
jgi:predicted metal-dependent hydrolase